MIWERVTEVIRDKMLPSPAPRSLSALGADMHAHLIPGIDDGAADEAAALAMLREMEKAGYSTCYATPHVMQDYYPNTREIILQGVEQLRAIAKRERLQLTVEAGAEYYLDDYFTGIIGKEELLALGGKYLLFELSFSTFPKSLPDVLFRLQAEGLKPVLAHPERYPYLFRKKNTEQLEGIRQRGCLFQVNLGSLAGKYGPEVRRSARQMVDAGMVDFLGSDLHRADQAEMFDIIARDRWFHQLLDSGKLLNQVLTTRPES